MFSPLFSRAAIRPSVHCCSSSSSASSSVSLSVRPRPTCGGYLRLYVCVCVCVSGCVGVCRCVCVCVCVWRVHVRTGRPRLPRGLPRRPTLHWLFLSLPSRPLTRFLPSFFLPSFHESTWHGPSSVREVRGGVTWLSLWSFPFLSRRSFVHHEQAPPQRFDRFHLDSFFFLQMTTPSMADSTNWRPEIQRLFVVVVVVAVVFWLSVRCVFLFFGSDRCEGNRSTVTCWWVFAAFLLCFGGSATLFLFPVVGSERRVPRFSSADSRESNKNSMTRGKKEDSCCCRGLRGEEKRILQTLARIVASRDRPSMAEATKETQLPFREKSTKCCCLGRDRLAPHSTVIDQREQKGIMATAVTVCFFFLLPLDDSGMRMKRRGWLRAGIAAQVVID